MAAPTDRLQTLEKIEAEIATVLHTAASVLQELAKDKVSIKQVETHSTMFLKQLNGVETELTRQINYLTQVSTGQPHEGSSYASAKVLQMARHRLQHARNEAAKLDAKRGHAAAAPGAGRPAVQGPPPPYPAPAGQQQQVPQQQQQLLQQQQHPQLLHHQQQQMPQQVLHQQQAPPHQPLQPPPQQSQPPQPPPEQQQEPPQQQRQQDQPQQEPPQQKEQQQEPPQQQEAGPGQPPGGP